MTEITEETVFYNGMNILKSQFRVYIYGFDGEKKLIDNFEEFQSHISSGTWFESLEILERRKAEKKKSRKFEEKSSKSMDKIKGA